VRAVVQRVSRAEVRVEGRVTGRIGAGFLVLLGVARGDGPPEADRIARKIAGLRLLADADGRMNRDLGETGGAVLLVSQFTLLADCRKGRRPSFVRAAPPEEAAPLCREVEERLRRAGLPVETGVFAARMEVELVNDGPVTVLLDTDDREIL
jgi:D-tyrosyl-tRNA(Tyr) deacylase